MDFKDFFSKQQSTKDFYWALVIEPNLVQAAIWTIDENKAKVIMTSNPVSWIEDRELVEACDASLSSAVQNLPSEISEPTKTVFGVSSKWVENGEIKEEYIGKIKKVCNELSLEPSGFVVLSEAIAYLYKTEEGSPLSAVVVATREESIEVSLFSLGNLVGTTSVARSVSIAEDVIEGLTRFGINDSCPSRFLIYDGKEGELEEIKQSLLSYDWESGEKIKFLHTPKIEIINPERKITATALAGAAEISNVSVIEGLQKDTEEKSGDLENVKVPDKTVKPEDLGFLVGEDIDKNKPIESVDKPVPPSQVNIVSTDLPKTVENKENVFTKIFKNIKEGIPKLSPKKNIEIKNGKNKLVYSLIIFSVLLVIGFLLWWFLPKAAVTVYVSPKKLENKLSVTIDPGEKENNFSENLLSGQIISSQKDGEKTKSTTGTKTVGEKAKGTVKIQNGTANSIRLAAGTTLYSSGDLQFTLDSSASISAAISPSLPGEANIDVTAANIGADSNLAKDEILKVSNYPKSDVDAIVVSNFSGGSSRQISAVSDSDQKDLLKNLKDELLVEAKAEIKGKIGTDLMLIESSLVATDSSRVFSNKVGDEAVNLKLNLSINSVGVAINKKDFFDFINNSLSNQMPSGFILRDDQLTARFELVENKESKYVFDVFVEVNLLPKINIDEIREKIKGKSKSVVNKYLETVPGYTRADIKFIPMFPGKLNTLPHIPKNISIGLATER
jgi:hypothetical protein